MSYVEEARELIRNLNQRMGPSPYDIAWMARLRTSADNGARWPDLIDWLLANQHSDGSWGGKIEYYHDRIVCTLATAIALHENGRTEQVQKAIKRAERYLWHHLHRLPHDPYELVPFEVADVGGRMPPRQTAEHRVLATEGIPVEREVRCRQRDRLLGHSEHDTGLLVLGKCSGPCLPHVEHSFRAILPHSCKHDPYCFWADVLGDRVEKYLYRGTMPVDLLPLPASDRAVIP